MRISCSHFIFCFLILLCLHFFFSILFVSQLGGILFPPPSISSFLCYVSQFQSCVWLSLDLCKSFICVIIFFLYILPPFTCTSFTPYPFMFCCHKLPFLYCVCIFKLQQLLSFFKKKVCIFFNLYVIFKCLIHYSGQELQFPASVCQSSYSQISFCLYVLWS